MNRFAINTIGDELEACAEFCASEGIGIEVTDFAFPQHLDSDLMPRITRHLKALEGLSPVISHGPFLDLVAASIDPAIVDICRKRHRVSLEAAHHIGATVYVAHTNYNPVIRNPSYRSNFTQRMLDFWLPFADWAGERNITICLENNWEPGPEIQADIIAKACHPHLKATFDNGHVLLFSEIPAAKWIEALGGGLAHCHLHDNSGEIDEHKPVGEGKEDWPVLLAAIRKWSPDAVLVAESDQLGTNRKSIERLKDL